MKEIYKSPVLNLLCLQPAERLASTEDISYDTLSGNGGNDDGGSYGYGGVEIDIRIP